MTHGLVCLTKGDMSPITIQLQKLCPLGKFLEGHKFYLNGCSMPCLESKYYDSNLFGRYGMLYCANHYLVP